MSKQQCHTYVIRTSERIKILLFVLFVKLMSKI